MRLLHLRGDKLSTGFVGTPLLCRVLSQVGEDKMAYHLLHNEEYPGWLYEVNLGATTIWERWNSLSPDRQRFVYGHEQLQPLCVWGDWRMDVANDGGHQSL